jgi:hypothetical protein
LDFKSCSDRSERRESNQQRHGTAPALRPVYRRESCALHQRRSITAAAFTEQLTQNPSLCRTVSTQ